MSGNLVIRPLTAKLTHDTEAFGKMDPYCKVIMGDQFKRTAVCTDGGKTPGWKEELSFRHTKEDLISVEVWDKDHASDDDLIGQGTIAFSTIASKGYKCNEWINLTYKGKSAGQVLLDIQYFPDGGKVGTQGSYTTTTTATIGTTGGFGTNPFAQPTFQQQPQSFPMYQQPTYVQPTYVQTQPTYQQAQPTFIPQQQGFVQQQPTYIPQQQQQGFVQQQPTYIPQQQGFQQQGFVQQQPTYQQGYPQQQGYQQGYPQQGYPGYK